MSHATLTGPGITTVPMVSVSLRRVAGLIAGVAATTLQSVVFAGVVWLILAGPGLLQDFASTVPLR